MEEVGKAPGGAWAWIKRHSSLLLAGGVGLVAVWFLFLRGGGSSSQQPTAIDLTGAGQPSGGGGGGGGPIGPATPNTLPFGNIDYGVLAAIKDDALRALYEKEFNLEQQINQATLNGNTALVNTLTAALQSVQDQITNYTPSNPTSTPSTATPTVNAADVLTWQNTWFSGPAETFNTWVQDAPAILRATFTQAQLQRIYNYFTYRASSGNRYTSTDQIVHDINSWLANPSTIPTAPPSGTHFLRAQ